MSCIAGCSADGSGQRLENKTHLRTLLRVAASCRALGLTWRQIARQVGRTEGTCRAWPGRHRKLWAELVAEVEPDVYQELVGRARAALLEVLDDANPFARQKAADSLLRHYDKAQRCILARELAHTDDLADDHAEPARISWDFLGDRMPADIPRESQ